MRRTWSGARPESAVAVGLLVVGGVVPVAVGEGLAGVVVAGVSVALSLHAAASRTATAQTSPRGRRKAFKA
jgi:hypothetical protein